MRIHRRLAPHCLVASLLLLGPVAVVQGGEPAESSHPEITLKDLAFMAGCWEGALGDSGQTVRETFSLADGRLMLGNSQIFAGGETAFFEFSRIEASDEGIRYIPYPAGKQSVPFQLVAFEDGRAVFENLEHDFPQRIIYQQQDGGLLARIEGDVEGELRFEEYPMRAAPCEVEP